GLTSHDVVFKLRKILKMKKIGHTGTLDPEVDGVLPICLGNATRVSDYVMEMGKTYKAEVTLGVSTTTEDQTGDILEVKGIDTDDVTEQDID
ncbi:tRNA pseudouridine(55) synthase TruB, partial [Staphylococcus epidermidis]